MGFGDMDEVLLDPSSTLEQQRLNSNITGSLSQDNFQPMNDRGEIHF